MRPFHANIGWGDRDADQFIQPKIVDSVTGCLVYLKRRMLDKCGFYDESWQEMSAKPRQQPLWMEQDDLCLTAWEHGITTVVAPHIGAMYSLSMDEIVSRTTNAPEAYASYWLRKWGWHPFFPDLHAIRRRWINTPLCREIGNDLLDSWPSDHPPVDVIIPTRNRVDTLKALFASLARTDYPTMEVHILNNGSTDSTRDYLEETRKSFPFPLTAIHLPVNIGVPAALNWLVSISKAPLVARMEDEVSFSPDWLKNFVSSLRDHPYVGVVGGKLAATHDSNLILNADSRFHPEIFCHSGERDGGQCDYLSYVSCILEPCCLYRRKALLRAGPFELIYGPCVMDDLDHPIAVQAAGYDVLYNGHVKILHPHKASSKKNQDLFILSHHKLHTKWGRDVFEILDKSLDFRGRRLEDLKG